MYLLKSETLLDLPFDALADKRVDKVVICHYLDESADLSYLEQGYEGETEENAEKYREQDKDRVNKYNRGDWCMIGIRAECEVSYSTGQGNRRIERFTSSGLWGIESDSSPEYLKEIEAEELASLKNHLEKLADITFEINQ